MNNSQDRCFACDRRLGKAPKLVGCKDDQTAYVGRECFKCIEVAGERGWQPPKGGPRLYLLKFTKHAAKQESPPMSAHKVVIDVWAGEYSQDHVARFIRPIDDALEISRVEIERGYLINLRADAAWGDYEDFDVRTQTKHN